LLQIQQGPCRAFRSAGHARAGIVAAIPKEKEAAMSESRKQRLIREAVGPDYPSAYTAIGIVRVSVAIAILSLAAVTTGQLDGDVNNTQVAKVEVVQ
jgi:hypothetical protein